MLLLFVPEVTMDRRDGQHSGVLHDLTGGYFPKEMCNLNEPQT